MCFFYTLKADFDENLAHAFLQFYVLSRSGAAVNAKISTEGASLIKEGSNLVL